MYCIVILYSTYIVHVSATKVEEVEAYGLVCRRLVLVTSALV